MAVLDMLRKATADGDVDVLRAGVRVLAEAIMEAEVSELTGAAKGERAPDRRLTNRNGYRERRWDTRVGTIGLSIPKVRDGSYFPSLLEPRRRAEQALLLVVQEAHVAGVSTRRVEDLVEALGIASMSRCEVSRICAATMPRSPPSARARSATSAIRISSSTRPASSRHHRPALSDRGRGHVRGLPRAGRLGGPVVSAARMVSRAVSSERVGQTADVARTRRARTAGTLRTQGPTH